MTRETLWPGGPTFTQRDPVFKLGTDAILLAHFAPADRAGRAADLGCGSGILPVLLAHRAPGLTVDCVDIQPEAVALTAENAAQNGLGDRVRPRLGDIRQIRELLPAGAYDLVVANPPYFPAGSGRRSKRTPLADARDEARCTLDDVCRAAGYLLRWGGRLALVHRPERLSELMCAMTASGVEPKRLRTVAPTAGAAPSLILLEGRRGGRPGLTVEPPLPLTDGAGGDSPEIREIYHRNIEVKP